MPTWVVFQFNLIVALAALVMGWLLLCALAGNSRARAGDYAGAERWYRRTFSHRIRMGGLMRIAVEQVYAGDPAAGERTFRFLFDDARKRKDRGLERFVLTNLGASLIAQGRTGEALPILSWVVRGWPARQTAGALYNLAWIAFIDFDFETAERQAGAARRASRRRPSTLATLLALMKARLATRAGRFEEARQALSEAARTAGRGPDRGLRAQVRMAEGVLAFRTGDRQRGVELLLAGAGEVTGAERRGLAARWLLGVAHLARREGDEATAPRLEAAAAGLRGVMPLPASEDCAAYLAS